MKFKQILTNFVGNAATTVKAKIAQLNPINRFIKFSLQQIFDELIKDHKISYENLVSGIIQLPDLQLDTQKINHKYLFASPFTLNSGKIGHLKIKLPSFMQMDTQNIQVEIKQIQIELKPIENFEDNFKKIMEEIQQFLHLFVQQKLSQQFLVERGSQDYFKETLKQLLANIKIRVENIVVLVYLQSPNSQIKENPFYLLLRVPLINIHKGAQVNKGEKHKFEEVNFDCEIPQFTLHLMDINEPLGEGFPFSYPQQNHPSNILLFGLEDYQNLNIETEQIVPRLQFSICKSVELKQKRTKLLFDLPKIELMLNPNQIKILILFSKQLNDFNGRLQKVKKQLGIDQENPTTELSIPLLQKKSSLERKNQDVFTSISMSVFESNVLNFSRVVPKIRNSPDMFDSLLIKNQKNKGNLFQSIQQFNSVMEQSINQNQALNASRHSMVEQLQMINFKQSLQVKVQIKSVHLCVQKYNVQGQTERKWIKKGAITYPNIPNSYFSVNMQTMIFHLKQDKSVQVSFSEVKLEHVKFRQYNKLEKSKSESIDLNEDEFSDLRNTRHFYSECEPSMNSIQNHEHYCIEQILRISHAPSEKSMKEDVKMYDFLAPFKEDKENQIYKPSFVFNTYPANSAHKYTVSKLQFLDVSLSINTEVVKQALDLYLLIQKQLSIIQGSVSQKAEENKDQAKDLNPINKSKQILSVSIRSLNIAYLDLQLSECKSAVQKYMNDQKQKFQNCFCSLNTQGLYLQMSTINLQKTIDKTKLDFRSLDLGLITIQDSVISRTKSFLSINTILNQNQQQRHFQLSFYQAKKSISSQLFLIIPEICICIDEKQTIDCIHLVKRQLQSLKFPLSQVGKSTVKKQNLQAQLMQPKIQVYVETLNIKFLKTQILMKHLYIAKQSSLLMVKLSTLVLAIRDNIQFYSSQMQNQKLILTPCSTSKKHSSIQEAKTIMQIHEKPTHQYRLSKQKMSDFFKRIFKSKSTIEFNMIGHSHKLSNSEELKQIMALSVSAPININAVNILKILDSKTEIDSFMKKVTNSFKELEILISQIFPQKANDHIKDVKQNFQYKELKLSTGRIRVDIRPTFIQSKKTIGINSIKQFKKVVFSNTRSFLSLSWDQFNIQMYLKQQRTYVNGNFNIKYHFKVVQNFAHPDPLLINEAQLNTRGYNEIFKIEKLKVTLEIIQKNVRLIVGLDLIQYSSSLQVLTWLGLHWKQFLNHNVKNNFGFTLQQDEERFQAMTVEDLNFKQESDGIVDLNNGFKIYTERNNRRNQLQTAFMQKKFLPPFPDLSCQFYLQQLAVNQVKFKIFNESTSVSNVEIYLNELKLSAKIPDLSNISLQLYGTLKDIEITHENKTQQNNGVFGFFSNWYNANNYGKFTVLKNQDQLKFLFEKDSDKSYLKFSECFFDIGFRSVILDLVTIFKEFKEQIKQSGWKKVYEEQIPVQQTKQKDREPLVLISIPQNRINVSLIYEGYSILSSCSVNAPKFLLHEESSNLHKINECIVGWVKSLLLKNVAGLVTGALIDSFNLAVNQIVDLITFLVSCILGIFR